MTMADFGPKERQNVRPRSAGRFLRGTCVVYQHTRYALRIADDYARTWLGIDTESFNRARFVLAELLTRGINTIL